MPAKARPKGRATLDVKKRNGDQQDEREIIKLHGVFEIQRFESRDG
jgi:hypothetical protein